MKLGYIDYLNCYPFYFHMFEKEPLEDVSIVYGYPGALNKMMVAGDLDMSPISSATCADIADRVVVLPDFCLSSVGYVGSVILAGKVPIEELDKKCIGLSSASHTSVVLLKMLLKNYYQIEPEYVSTGPRLDLMNVDAALIIGNDAMVNVRKPAPYRYDIGDLWLRKTGFPVVFAVFAVRESVLDKYESTIKAVIRSYHNSIKCLDSEREQVILKAQEKYPDIIYDIHSYYELLGFEFTEELKGALEFYHTAAAELGLIRRVEKLRYYE